MQRPSSDTLDARDPRLRCGDQHTATITSRSERLLELKTATVLERLGLRLDSGDGPFVRALLPFVIDPESVQTIPPLASIPSAFVIHQPGQSGATQRGEDSADAQAISCQHLALQPVPVLAPALAHLLIGSGDGLEVEFIDGNNVYGANVFERHEGRRLLRRAIGFVYDQLESDGRDFDIIVHEADGFLVVRPYRAGAESLRDRLQRIIAAMNGEATDLSERSRILAHLATFYRHARTALLAPAGVSHEPRDDLSRRIAGTDVFAQGSAGERFARLETTFDHLTQIISASRHRPVHEQAILLTLMEHRMYDPVLQTLTGELSLRGHRVRAFKHPGELLRRLQDQPVAFYRLELVSLLKSINEHPHGGFLAGNEVLKAIYTVLVETLQNALHEASVDRAAEVCTFRRWSDFFFAVDEERLPAPQVCSLIEGAFSKFRYVAVDTATGPEGPAYSVALLETCPAPEARRMVMPLMPTVARETRLSADMLSMSIEEPARKAVVIERRLDPDTVTDVDVAFLADWTVNARDPKRGIPRLVSLFGATDDDIVELACHYESFVNRKGSVQHRLRRDAAALRGFQEELNCLVARRRV